VYSYRCTVRKVEQWQELRLILQGSCLDVTPLNTVGMEGVQLVYEMLHCVMNGESKYDIYIYIYIYIYAYILSL
jgi:hypothetical protein